MLRQHYDEATDERRKVDARLTKIQAAITALTALESGEAATFTGSLADACRAVLKGNTTYMSPTEVRDGVVALGYLMAQHKNPMASIHSVLKRLEQSGNASTTTTRTKTKNGTKDETVYLWTGRAATDRTVASIAAINSNLLGESMAEIAASLNVGDLQQQFKEIAEAVGAFNTSGIAETVRDAQAIGATITANLPKILKP